MFKRPFSSEGRIRRKEYGFTMIIYTVLISIVVAISEEMQMGNTDMDMDAIVGISTMVLYLALLWFFYAQGAKRCHDVGKSAWWLMIPFYPFVLLFKEGIDGSNEYGDNPKAENTKGMIDSIGETE